MFSAMSFFNEKQVIQQISDHYYMGILDIVQWKDRIKAYFQKILLRIWPRSS